ncbi:hypothetical protein JGH11_14035 [Dysgonomonas sp. Marseille-P4677]|uniref:hypothetical protein n=1 Tax=Dysgonomonas sp. Marseille-P4677 TaxID=2364790 RepID=UPI001911E265|nr:hypothetical protein [Dysgonomonas sp. Marseille-P4677]MBK5721994.1 hypothetical protein [Dysgonomonas sp. Marseille-P4677]
MKALNLFGKLFLVTSIALLSACSDNNDDPVTGGGGEGEKEQILFKNGTELGNGEQSFVIKENHTIKKGTYVMKGWVYIEDGATLTIEPGTVIKGDKDTKAALIARRGGKLIAKGTITEPIVFTSNQPKGSRKPGDWGGVILCGRAKNNADITVGMRIEGGVDAFHGGNNDNDNSGIVSYVRIEYAGYPFATDQEINGFTMGSVGRGTQIDHVQVSYSNDDSFEWFGGTVNAKYLVAYHGWDDDFDTDNGYSGKLQFLLGIRNPKIADQSLSNGFESDNNSNGTTDEPYTKAVFSNVTLIGPMGQADDFTNTTQYIAGDGLNPNNGSRLGVFQAAIQIRRNSRLNLFNSIATGYPVGLILDNQNGTTQKWATDGILKLQNNVFAGMGILGADINKQAPTWTDQLSTNGTAVTDATKASFSSTFFKLASNNNKSLASIADLKLKQPSSKATNPNYGPVAGSPALGLGSFTDALLNDSFFTKVNYSGAFSSDSNSDNWLSGWTNFDPQNTTY